MSTYTTHLKLWVAVGENENKITLGVNTLVLIIKGNMFFNVGSKSGKKAQRYTDTDEC